MQSSPFGDMVGPGARTEALCCRPEGEASSAARLFRAAGSVCRSQRSVSGPGNPRSVGALHTRQRNCGPKSERPGAAPAAAGCAAGPGWSRRAGWHMAGVKQLDRNGRTGCEGTVCSPLPSRCCLSFGEETARLSFGRKGRAPSYIGGLGAVHGPGAAGGCEGNRRSAGEANAPLLGGGYFIPPGCSRADGRGHLQRAGGGLSLGMLL